MSGDDDTLPRLLWRNARAHGDDIAMREKEFGIWRALNWSEVADRTRDMALGLRAIGVEAGDVAGLIGDKVPDWVMEKLRRTRSAHARWASIATPWMTRSPICCRSAQPRRSDRRR